MNTTAISKDLADLFIPVLKKAGIEFLDQSKKDFEELAEDELNAIYWNAIHSVIVLPVLENPTDEQAAFIEGLIAKNDQYLLVISEVEKRQAKNLKAAQERALGVAKTIGVTAAAGLVLAAKTAITAAK